MSTKAEDPQLTGKRSSRGSKRAKQHDAASGEQGWSSGKRKLILIFGVILPILAVAFESTFHFCAQNFFDPFPSSNHVVLFLLIPLSNFLALRSASKNMSSHYAFMSLASGMAMGMAIMYSLMFLPLVGRCFIYSVYLGFGLLGLAPIMALPCIWRSSKTVAHLASNQKTYFNAHQVEHMGHLIILVMVLAVELPSTLTRVQMDLASHPETAADAYRWLRRYGSEEILLRACYERSGRATDILGSMYESAHPLSVDEARNIFYRVTGKPFNSVAIPASARATIQRANMKSDPAGLNAGVEDEFDLDLDIAGESVSGVARGLTVGDSKISGKIDSAAMLADIDWTFSFKNSSKYDREARTKILLPPGAVVTKATLTVNDVEHDATIMVREAAREVYRQAVMQHKEDPLLVSTCGIDQILVQCFPVHSNATLKVKLTIAAPLSFDEKHSAALILPTFMEKNFLVEFPTAVDFESEESLFSDAKGFRAKDYNHIDSAERATGHRLQGSLSPLQIAQFAEPIHVSRTRDLKEVFCQDTFAKVPTIVSRQIQAPSFPLPKRLSVVVDGSLAMKEFMPQIIQGLKSVPSTVATEIILVADESKVLCPDTSIPGSAAYAKALKDLQDFKPAGGQTDLPALDAFLLKRLKGDSATLLWIHAAQPALRSVQSIKPMLHGPAAAPIIYDLQVSAGPDDILDGVEQYQGVARVPQIGSPAHSIEQLFKTWTADPAKSESIDNSDSKLKLEFANSAEFSWRDSAGDEADGQLAGLSPHKAPASLAQVAAYSKLLDDLAHPLTARPDEANELAKTYHLVSPISSAVVVDPIPEMAAVVITPQPRPYTATDFLLSARGEIDKSLLSIDSLLTPTFGRLCEVGSWNFEALDPTRYLVQSISQSFSSITGQLNRLNSVQPGGGGGGYSAYSPSYQPGNQKRESFQQEGESPMKAWSSKEESVTSANVDKTSSAANSGSVNSVGTEGAVDSFNKDGDASGYGTAGGDIGVGSASNASSQRSMPPRARSKAAWYSAPREVQIVDGRPMVRDFRAAPSSIQLPSPPQGFGGKAAGGASSMSSTLADAPTIMPSQLKRAAQARSDMPASPAATGPMLQGTSIGTIGPQGTDATVAQSIDMLNEKKQLDAGKKDIVSLPSYKPTEAVQNHFEEIATLSKGKDSGNIGMRSSLPQLQATALGSGGPTEQDATVIMGVNTAGIVRPASGVFGLSSYGQSPMQVIPRLFNYFFVFVALISAALFVWRSTQRPLLKTLLAVLIILSIPFVGNLIVGFCVNGLN